MYLSIASGADDQVSKEASCIEFSDFMLFSLHWNFIFLKIVISPPYSLKYSICGFVERARVFDYN